MPKDKIPSLYLKTKQLVTQVHKYAHLVVDTYAHTHAHCMKERNLKKSVMYMLACSILTYMDLVTETDLMSLL